MKILVRKSQYTFDPSLGTIILAGLPPITLAEVLLITNVSAGVMLYSFVDPQLGGSMDGDIITLQAPTTGMTAEDDLQIWIDAPAWAEDGAESAPLETAYTTDTNLQQVFGSAPLLDGGRVKVAVSHRSNMVRGVLSGLGAEVRIDCKDMSTVGIQISGTWSGTVSFEGSVNGADFVAINVAQINATATNSTTPTITSTTNNNVWMVNASALTTVRARFSAVTSGMPVVDLLAATGAGGGSAPSQTYDANMGNVLGTVSVYQPSDTDAKQQVVAPSVSPTQPTSYADNKYASFPQRFRRLRVETGGDQRLPFAQDQLSGRQLVTYPELYARIEELIMQQALTNQLLAMAFNLPLPTGMEKIY